MIATWMLYSFVLAILISGIAYAVDRAAGLVNLPRRPIWIVAMAGSVTAPLMAFANSRGAGSAGSGVPDAVGSVGPVVIASSDIGFVAETWIQRLAAVTVLDLPLVIAWTVASVVLLTGFAIASWRIQRDAKTWAPTVLHGVPVLMTPDVGPAVIGTFPSSIVVPTWFETLDVRRRETVMHHEREHLIRGDTRVLQGGLMLAAAVPWLLPLWWQLRRLREAIELDCDRRVLRAGVSAADYAHLLLDLSERQRPFPGLAATLAERPTLLARRIDSMLTRKPKHFGPQLAALTVASALLAVAACDTPVPPTEVPDDAIAAGRAAADLDRAPVRLNGPAPRYPTMLRQAGIEGDVTVRMLVKKDGTVDPNSLEVLESSHRAFVGPAIDVLRESTYEPGLAGGEPVPAVVEQTITFAMSRERALRVDEIDGDTADTSLVFIRRGVEPLDESAAWNERAATTGVLVRRSGEPNERLAAAVSRGDGPLVFIDGKPADAAILETLDPVQIESIEVVKGSAARDAYGEAGANGVILIKRK